MTRIAIAFQWLAVVCASVLPVQAQTKAPAITLPEILAVELPRGAHDLGADDPPLRELLGGARSGTLKVTADLATRIGVGPVQVTWTAWDAGGKQAASRSAVICVLPAGMTPVGTSGDENATAGNNATRIVRDPAGHVHMMWADSGGPSGRTGPVYRRAVIADDGTVHLETPALYVAEGGPADWNSYPALALAGDAVQLIWQSGGFVRTRRVSPGANGPTLGPVSDTGAKSEGRDVGPAIAADSHGLYVATPSGIYASSTDGGRSWRSEALPLPTGQHPKTVSLAAVGDGAVDVAFSGIARERVSGGKDKGGGGWWQLRTIRRTQDGSWKDPRDALADFPEWGAPPLTEDALVDWVRIAAGNGGSLHVTWHGTAKSRIFGNDTAFYAWRDAAGTWHTPVQLVPRDPARGIRFSFAPSLAVDGDDALAVVFYDVFAGTAWIGFDAALAVMRHGKMAGSPYPVTQFVASAVAANRPELALSTRFPAAAPGVWRAPDGRVWLDVLETLRARFPGAAGSLIVYHRVDVTAALRQ